MTYPNILAMGKEEILQLQVPDVRMPMPMEEFFHIGKILGSLWAYDHQAAKQGKVGMHAELKSKLHSDVFFVSKIFLEPENICEIMAYQMVDRLQQYPHQVIRPTDYVGGIPDGATKLGKWIARLLGSKEAKLEKKDGKIVLESSIPDGATLLLIDDVCTRGTAILEAAGDIKQKCPGVKILPYDPVILNRGGLSWVQDMHVGRFTIIPIVERKIDDWPAEKCPLCALGSKPIKPKATEENWKQLNESQR